MKKLMCKKNKGKGDNLNLDCCNGFTLIELALVVLISGIMIVPLMRMYSSYLREQTITTTKENLISAARSLALSSPTRYPCPSNRALPVTDPNYGTDVCSIPGFLIANIPDCDTTGAEQGVCKTIGARDTSEDGDTDTIVGNNNELVLIGGAPLKIHVVPAPPAVPYDQPIGTTGSKILDGWGNQFTYAVSYTSSRPDRFDGFTRYKNGVIRVVDEWARDTAGTNLDAQFILISHGEDGSGAYTSNGAQIPCVLGNTDSENCDGDNTFVQGIAHYGGAMKYDDYSYVRTDTSANLWQIITDPAVGPTTHISKIPNGEIGIKITDPTYVPPTNPANVDIRLDVNGDIRADTVRTTQICNIDNTICMNIDDTTGFFGTQKTTGTVINSCPAGKIIERIENQKVTCNNAEINFRNTQIRCPVGTWLEQVFTDGSIRCTGGISCPGGSGCL